VSYDSSTPYAKIYNYNLNALTHELIKFRPECPTILKSNHQLLFSETLPFHNVEVASFLEKNCELTSKVSNKYM